MITTPPYLSGIEIKQNESIKKLEKDKKHYKALYKIQKEHSKKLSKLLDEAIEIMKSRNK